MKAGPVIAVSALALVAAYMASPQSRPDASLAPSSVASVAASKPEDFEPVSDRDDYQLAAMKRWEWFMALVSFNANRAVECGLRDAAWRDRVILISHAEVNNAGEYFAILPQLSDADRAAWRKFRQDVPRLAEHWYGLPCSQFRDLPLLQVYDSAARNGGPIPVPGG